MQPRTKEFRDSINLALEQAGLDGRLEYSDVEALLHMTFDKGNKAVPWFQIHKQTILNLEDNIENVLLTVAGYALAVVTPESEDKEITYAFLRAMHDWRDQYRRQFDPGGLLPSGERYWLPGHPTTFGAIEDGAASQRDGEPKDYDLERVLQAWGADIEDHSGELELDPEEFEDPRLRAMWEVADSDEKDLIRHLGAGMAVEHAAARCGRSGSWGSYRLKKLRERVGA